jgi:hypothetical protein
MSVGLRGTQMLSPTICIRLLIDVRCLEVTPEGCVKSEPVDFTQLQGLFQRQVFAERIR